jgi:hypothetical protein
MDRSPRTTALSIWRDEVCLMQHFVGHVPLDALHMEAFAVLGASPQRHSVADRVCPKVRKCISVCGRDGLSE